MTSANHSHRFFLWLLLVCAFFNNYRSAGALQQQSGDETRSLSDSRELQDENQIVDCTAAAIAAGNSVGFTSYLSISGLTLFQEEEEGGGDETSTAARSADLLISTLIATYSDYNSVACGNENGGRVINGARILSQEEEEEEAGEVLLEVNATCMGCLFESDLRLFNHEDDDNDETGGGVRARQLANLDDYTEQRLLQQAVNDTSMDHALEINNTMVESNVETNTTMESSGDENNNTLNSTLLAACYCEPQPQATFLDAFQEALVLQDIVSETQVLTVDVKEVSIPVSCASIGDLRNLTEIVLVDFVVSCSLVDADSVILANAFVNIYNKISQEEYCDPYFRRLTSARVIRRGDTRSDEGALTIELELIGSCRGCDPEVDGFYDPLVDISIDANFININEAIDTEIVSIDVNNTGTNSTGFNTTDTNSTEFNTTGDANSVGFNTTDSNSSSTDSAGFNDTDTNSSIIPNNSSTRRSLLVQDEKAQPRSRLNRQLFQQLGDGTCYCPLNAIANRAPSEAEVMDAFRDYVQTAEEGLLRCVTSIGQCQFGTTFESNFLVAFTQSNTTINFASEIELSLQDTLNALLAPRVGICRPEFRLVQSVSSTIGVNLAGEEELLRRQLHVGDMSRDYKRRTQDVSFEPAMSPSSLVPSALDPPQTTEFPSFPSTLGPSASYEPSSAPTTSPTTLYSSSLLVLLRVTGVCNGCTSDLLLGNQVITDARRNLNEDSRTEDPSNFDTPRFLQLDTTVSDSNCFCPIESVVQEGLNPSAEVVLDEYQDRLEQSAVPAEIRSLQEVEVVNCEDEIGIFDTQVTLQFTLNQDVSNGELNQLAKLIEETYNDLTDEMYCDPLIRRIYNLDLDSMTLISSGEDGCDLFALTFEVRGGCRGCEDDSSLFYQGGDYDNENRRLNIPDWIMDRDTSKSKSNPRGGGSRHQGRRRRLEGSELCLCEGFTVGDRAPTLGELEEVLEGEIERERFDLICGLSSQFQEVPVTDAPSTTPSSVPSESPTECVASLENEFSTETILFVERGNNINADVRILLGEAIQSAYNELMQEEYRVCNPLFRAVTSLSPTTEDGEDRRGRRNLLRLEEKASFSHHSRSASRNLQEIGSAGVPIRYIVSGRCESCRSDSNVFDALTGDQVLSRVKSLSEDFIDSGILLGISEIESIECSSNVVKFDEVVIVEMVATCPEDENFGFDDALIADIEHEFVETYNALAPLYCDEHFTVLADAEVENVGVITEDGNIPVEIRVFAECLGCDPQEFGIYGNPSAIQRISDGVANRNLQGGLRMVEEDSISQVGHLGRFLQNNRETCICSAQAVADRPPSESEFIAAFRQNVEALRLGCVSSVGECQFGSTFDTDIVLSFEGNQTSLTEEVRATIQENFLKLLNDLYEPNEDVCNPDFRVVIDVAVVFDFTLNGEFIELGSNGTSPDDDLVGGGRALGDDDVSRQSGLSWSRKNQETNDTTIPSTSPITAGPTTVFDVGSGDQNTQSLSPTSSPTSVFDSSLIRTLLTVSGVCNGCVNELFLSNQVLTGARKLEEQDESTHEFERWLQGRSVEANSNCFCPLTAIVNLLPPTPEEVQGALSRRLEEEEIELVVRNIDTVSAIACDDEQETTQFTGEFTIAFSALDTVPDAEIQKFGDTIAAVYNGLVEEYCDPLIRRDIVLELKDRNRVIRSGTGEKKRVRRDLQKEDDTDSNLAGGDNQANCVNFEATFKVQGKCRGCDDGTPLLDVSNNGKRRSLEVHNRILSSGGRTERTRRRHLMDVEEECFCDSNTIAPRAPTLDELWVRLELELGSFVAVCGQPVDCDPSVFVSQFSETTILALLLERGTVLTEEHLLELELAYMSGYNVMQDNLRVDKCGGRFRQMSSLTVDRSILGAGGGGIIDEGDNGQRYLAVEGEDGEWSGEGRRLSVQSVSMVASGECTRDCRADDDRDVISSTVDSVRDLGFVKEVLSVNEFLTGAPSSSPSSQPSTQPSTSPSSSPSTSPSLTPSTSPSTSPSTLPSVSPSVMPSVSPSTSPSMSPSTSPSSSPSTTPSIAPSTSPSSVPSISPSMSPSTSPSIAPSTAPSTTPSTSPSTSPSTLPSMGPSVSAGPSASPSQVPSGSAVPSVTPSSNPSSSPSNFPSLSPSISANPSSSPSMVPSGSIMPSLLPSQRPSGSVVPSVEPSSVPSSMPSDGPSLSALPSGRPSDAPSGSTNPSSNPSDIPSESSNPSSNPSDIPSRSIFPSSKPSPLPSVSPSRFPSSEPSTSMFPSGRPTSVPSPRPTESSTCDDSLCGSLNGELPPSLSCTGSCVCNTPTCPNCIGSSACGKREEEDVGVNSCLGEDACSGSTTGSISTDCCIGDFACEGISGTSIKFGSCNAESACQGITAGSVGSTSCNVKNICRECITSPTGCNSIATMPGTCTECLPASVGTGSCIDGNLDLACWGFRRASSGVTIGMSSCTGVDSCARMDLASVGDFSCTADQACEGASGDIGGLSCTDDSACFSATTSSGIGNGSCTDIDACSGVMTSSIGNGSCTGKESCSGFSGDSIGDSACTLSKSCSFCSATVLDNQCDGVNFCPC